MNWMGAWGRANLHRSLGWLCYEFNRLAGPYTRVGIWNGRGGVDNLRALGHVPQHDRLIFAVRKDLGITSYDDIRKKKPKLRITTGIDDGINFVGYGVQSMMAAAGIPRDAFEAWGGTYLEREEPPECIQLVLDGRADAIVHEAVMTKWWQDLAETLDLTFLPIEPDARDRL